MNLRVIPIALLWAISTAPIHAEYLAYAVIDGQKTPLPESLDPVDSKYLVNVAWGTSSARPIRVGILPVQNNSAAAAMQMSYNGVNYSMPTVGGGGVPVQGIEAIITTVMDKTGRFRLLERSVIDQALREQDLAADGRTTRESSARSGKVLV